jgi:hypothetical protein
MTISVRHSKVSGVQDSGDGKVSSNAWNDDHNLSCASGVVLGRSSVGTGPVEEIPIASLGGGSGTISAADRIALADSPTNTPIILTEAGREGIFVYSSGDFSDEVTADPNQGIYVAPSLDATGGSGAWIRKFDGPAISLWWGVSTGATATANVAAFQAALDTLKALHVSSLGHSDGSIGLHTPAGVYQFNASLTVNHGLVISGDYTGQGIDGTDFVWSANCHGFNQTAFGMGATFKGLMLKGNYTSSDGTYHAINAGAKGQYIDLYTKNWPGVGIYGDGVSGNFNGSYFQNIYAEGCQWTVMVEGSDANGCKGYGIDALTNRRGCIYDKSFLGNYWSGGLVESCGNISGFLSRCEKNGHIYVVAYGQETWCSTNSPSGTTASNTGWLYHSEGSSGATQPTWTTGLTWYWSAALASLPDNNNMWSRFSGFYIEGNCNPIVLSTHSMFFATFPGVPVWTNLGVLHSGTMTSQGSTYMNFASGINANGNITATAQGPWPGSITAAGAIAAGATITAAAQIYSTGGGFRAQGSPYSGSYSGAGCEFGYYAPYGGYLQARTLPADTTLPFKIICSAFTIAPGASGTPSDAFSVSTTGFGYPTGVGGAVTQATSRTTGVTLNKVCGAITLVSAAGSTSWQSFTVTNSTVAANDTIRVCQKSGTDKYQAHVTAVAAGSFEITYATTGGTTTEQPVFNFAVIKGAAS